MPQFKSNLDTQWLSKIADFIEETAHALGVQDPNVIYDLKLAVDEACTNIMTHGKKSQKKDHLLIQMGRQMNKQDRIIEVAITDFGNAFPFQKMTLPLKDLSIEEKLKNGFGVGLIKSVMEKTEYKSFPDKNILRLYKYF